MKLKNYLVIVLVLVLAGISWKEKPVQYYFKPVPEFPGDTAYYAETYFAVNGFGFPIHVDSLKRKFGSLVRVTKKPVGNIHDSKTRDTIVSVSGKGIAFNFYKSESGTGLMNAFLTSPKAVLINNIHVGMNKKQFLELFPMIPVAARKADILRIGNEEYTSFFEFVFTKNIITAIHFYNTAD
jgi:hypothetical protein